MRKLWVISVLGYTYPGDKVYYMRMRGDSPTEEEGDP